MKTREVVEVILRNKNAEKVQKAIDACCEENNVAGIIIREPSKFGMDTSLIFYSTTAKQQMEKNILSVKPYQAFKGWDGLIENILSIHRDAYYKALDKEKNGSVNMTVSQISIDNPIPVKLVNDGEPVDGCTDCGVNPCVCDEGNWDDEDEDDFDI